MSDTADFTGLHPDDAVWFERQSRPHDGSDPLHAYQKDRARLIHSSAFRRLQAKTQVIGLHHSDFYRTRLTHSLEVAQIGSALVAQLQQKSDVSNEAKLWLPDVFLIEAACLAHDIGHPPFGHGGEVALHYQMLDHDGFEGNAQTFRILTRLGEYHPDYGIDLTRRTLLGVVKYPQFLSHLHGKHVPVKAKATQYTTLKLDQWKPPKGLYREAEPVLQWLLKPFCEQDCRQFMQVQPTDRHAKTQFKSLDTSIMDLADDISYGVHDLEDGIAMKIIRREDWQREVVERCQVLDLPAVQWDELTNFLFGQSSRERKRGISRLVNYIAQAATIEAQAGFSHPLLKYKATLPKEYAVLLNTLQQFEMDYLIQQPEIKSMEYKGQQMILNLFDAYASHPKKLLSNRAYQKYDQTDGDHAKMRIIADYIAGMTNDFATKSYNKLFVPQHAPMNLGW